MAEPDTAVSFRDALSRFASGVVVVAAHTPKGPVGFTASAFTSVSLEPPLVLVCVAKSASAHSGIVDAPFFGVSILGRKQKWIAEQFANRSADRFSGVALATASGALLIDGALAHLECDRHALHDAGDHTIVVGRVVRSAATTGRPLVHCARSFGGFLRDSSPAGRDGDAVSHKRRMQGERA